MVVVNQPFFLSSYLIRMLSIAGPTTTTTAATLLGLLFVLLLSVLAILLVFLLLLMFVCLLLSYFTFVFLIPDFFYAILRIFPVLIFIWIRDILVLVFLPLFPVLYLSRLSLSSFACCPTRMCIPLSFALSSPLFYFCNSYLFPFKFVPIFVLSGLAFFPTWHIFLISIISLTLFLSTQLLFLSRTKVS